MFEILKLLIESQNQLTDEQIREAFKLIVVVFGLLYALIVILGVVCIYQFWVFEKKIKKLQDFSCKLTDKELEDHRSKNGNSTDNTKKTN